MFFVIKSSGLQGDYLNPNGLTHRGETLVDETLQGRKLPESLKSLESFKDKLTIIQGLSGKMTNSGHSSFYGALGGYKASAHAPPLFATIDGHLSEKFPAVFNHLGFQNGRRKPGDDFPWDFCERQGKATPVPAEPTQCV